MKLKPIPKNTVVHTLTEEEANELLQILHESEYGLKQEPSLIESYYFDLGSRDICYRLIPNYKIVAYAKVDYYQVRGYYIISLSQFKDKYVNEEEKPQPKFKVGDLVR